MARMSALLPSLLHRSSMASANADALHQSVKTVTISEVEYDYLVQTAYQFAKLKGSLLNGGLSQETLDVLIYGVQAPPKPSSQDQEVHKDYEQSAPQPAKPVVNTNRVARNTDSGYKTGGDSEDYGDEDEDDEYEDRDEEDGIFVSPAEENDDFEDSPKSGRSAAAAAASGQRTVTIRNLPDRTTDEDIVDAVRGGALLHIYFRPRHHLANASFVDESAAQGFLQHTKVYGLHVAGKRVETLWSDRQFYLPPYVRAKINGGASRILVINDVPPSITEQLIRRDLEHIHNLVVISVRFKDGNLYISTNSIHNALFARSCMMSRRMYKGMTIWFHPDECAGPLAGTINLPKKAPNPSPNKPASRPNRFQLLSLDGSEEEIEDGYESIPDGLNSHSSLNGCTWDGSQ